VYDEEETELKFVFENCNMTGRRRKLFLLLLAHTLTVIVVTPHPPSFSMPEKKSGKRLPRRSHNNKNL
jgi:hypothetical protein